MTPIDIDSLQTTNFEFDIEANRRRRAELANDVTELISISKFFLQHYSSDSPEDLPPLPRKIKDPTITKREKNASNVNKARGRSVGGRIVQTNKSPVAIATPTHVKRKQTRINNGRVDRMRGNDDDVPPLFDKRRLHEYCVDIVDRFFHGPPPNDSEISESPKNPPPPTITKKSKSIEKSVQTTTKCNNNEIILSKPRKNSKYASVPSRYMNETPEKSINDNLPIKNNSQYRFVSAKSLEILEEVARKGTEIKRHSCLIHKREQSVAHHEYGSIQLDGNRSQIRFHDIHPTIELIPSNKIFPKRILKQTSESLEPSSAELKTDEEEHIAKGGSSDVSPVKSNLSTNSMIEIKNSIDNDCFEHNHLKDTQRRGELKMQQLPVLSIKPQTKCEIENIYEIEIKPDEAKAEKFLSKDKNKVIQFVYESSELDAEQSEVHPNNLNQNQHLTNKYITPFNEGAHTEDRFSGENNTTDETHETSHLSLNLSSSSHLTDDEKFQSDKKITNGMSEEFKYVSKIQAKGVIDRILEAEGITESSGQISSGEESKSSQVKVQSKNRSDNFDDLREILRKIQNDKTTLEVALDAIEPPDLMSPVRLMTDREVQCDDISVNTKSVATQKSPKKSSARNTELHSPHNIDSSIMGSPKFKKTIESIQSSARKLDFSINNSEYRSATRQQIEKAAKKFLKSILKNADANMPLSASEREDSSYIHLKMDKQKYQIVDDQIIQSNFNVKSGECTSSSSSDTTSLQLRLPSARLLSLPDRSRMKCGNCTDHTDSDFTSHSIDKYIKNYRMNEKLPQQSLVSNGNNNYSDLSDGEILSDGEFYIP